MTAKRKCKAKTKAGKPCRGTPLTGKSHCISHSPRKTRAALGFGGVQPGSGRPANPRVVDVMRERVEKEIDAILEPYFDQLEGAVVHATFQGGVYPSDHPDTGARIEAAEKLLDRVYGRPTQTTALTGADGGAIRIEDVFADDNVRKGLHELVKRAGAARSSGAGRDSTGD